MTSTPPPGESRSLFFADGPSAQYNAPHGRIEIHEHGLSRASALRRPWLAPPMPTGIVERPGLTGPLMELVCREGADPVELAGVHGAGGFGKTTSVVWLCHQPAVRRRFSGGLLWVTLGEHAAGAELAGRVNDLAEQLTGTRPTFSEPLQAGLYLGQLLDEQSDPVLLVIDDVWAEHQLEPFRCGGARCRRVVTTRNRWLLPDGVRVAVDAMTSEEAQRLLSRDIPDPPGALVDDLVTATGRWPVLLALANRAAVKAVGYGTTGARALTQITDRLAEDGPVAFDVEDVHQRGRAVAATVRAGLDLLPAAVADRFAELAIFADDTDIPFAVLELFWGATGGLTSSGVRRTCEALAELSLVLNYRPDPGTIRLHDVVRGYLMFAAGPARLRALHNRLLDAAAPLAQPHRGGTAVAWWTLSARYDYVIANLARHLRAAGRDTDLSVLVTDLRWVEVRLRRHGVAGAEADLAYARDGVAVQLSRLIHQNGHLLTPSVAPHSLGAVLASRLDGVPELEPLVRSFRAALSRPVLEPAWPVPDLLDPVEPDVHEHTGGLLCCSFSPDGTMLATGSDDCSVRLRSLPDGHARSFVGHTARVRSCDFSSDGSRLATASDDHSVRLWRVGTGEQQATFRHPGGIRGCSFSPDDRMLLTAAEDGTARIWDLAGRTIAVMMSGHVGAINSCAFAPRGDLVATGGQDGTVRLWNAATGDVLHVFEGFSGPVNSCCFSPGGDVLAAADDQAVRLWSTDDGSHRRAHLHDSRVYSCAFSGDGRLLATACSDSKVRLLDVADCSVIAVLEGHTDVVTSCAFSPDAALVASTSHDQSARIWSVATKAEVTVFTGGRRRVSGCSFSPDGDLLVTAHDDGRGMIWDSAGRVEMVRLTGHRSRLSKCAFSPDGSLVVTTSADRTARLWQSATGELTAELRGHTARVRGCAFAPDGRTVATTSDDRSVRLWSLHAALRRTLEGHVGRVGSCAFSPDSATIASASEDRTVRLWQVDGGAAPAVLSGHLDMVTCCTFSPDGTLLASTSFDETTRLWRLPENVPATTLVGHTGWVESCAFSPSGRQLATIGRDSTIRIWDVATGRCECSLRVASPLICVAWHPSGTTLCAVGGAGLYVFRYLTS